MALNYSPNDDPVLAYFASAERHAGRPLPELAQEAVHDPAIHALFQAVHGYVLILDHQSKVIAANDQLLQYLSLDSVGQALGRKPGELFQCDHCGADGAGCGSSTECEQCGALRASLACQWTRRVHEGEASLHTIRDGKERTEEYTVRCSPMMLAGQPVTAMVLQDVGPAKRRDDMQRVFLHDLRNLLQAIGGYSELIQGAADSHYPGVVSALVNELREEVDGHQFLLMAESGELSCARDVIGASAQLAQVVSIFECHPALIRKHLDVGYPPQETYFRSDSRLLRRVLVNMMKNALEATPEGGEVAIRFELRDGAPTFTVWNPGHIAEDIQARMFQRSFSTKAGHGRGFGAYSMRLLGERYLGGKVGFRSEADTGTEFWIELPRVDE